MNHKQSYASSDPLLEGKQFVISILFPSTKPRSIPSAEFDPAELSS